MREQEGLPAAGAPVRASSVLAIGQERKAVQEVVAPEVGVGSEAEEEMAAAPTRRSTPRTVRGAYLRLRRRMN